MKRNVYLIILLIIIGNITTVKASAIEKEVRVGLVDKYYNIENIIVYNDFSMGYMEGEQWIDEASFENGKNYRFSPLKGYWLESKNMFSNFSSANNACDNIKLSEFKAIPTRKDKSNWSIFIGPFKTEKEAQDKLNSINGKYDFKLNDRSFKEYSIESRNEIVAIVDGKNNYPQFISQDESKVMNLGDRSYRGKLEIGSNNGRSLYSINQLSIEEYLYGVLPSEMSHLHPKEVQKAQAVTSRTYVLYNISLGKKYEDKPYHVTDTTSSQVYKGYASEKANSTKAVKDTEGEVILYNNQIIEPFYFASSGGYTESSENVWSAKLPYIKSVRDVYETNLNDEPWIKKLTKLNIKDILNRKNIHIGEIIDLEVSDYSNSGRAMILKVKGSQGVYEAKKEEIRRLFGLYSRKFQIIKENGIEKVDNTSNPISVMASIGKINKIENPEDIYTINEKREINRINKAQLEALGFEDTNNDFEIIPVKDAFTFVGQGKGHGVGMSQRGAYAMALEDFNYIEILKYYYNDVKIDRIY